MMETFRAGRSPAVFTTGEAAKIAHVSQQTIIRAFNTNALQGYKIPGSTFRRIPGDRLQHFFYENDIRVRVPAKHALLLITTLQDDIAQKLADTMQYIMQESPNQTECCVTNNSFDSGMFLKELESIPCKLNQLSVVLDTDITDQVHERIRIIVEQQSMYKKTSLDVVHSNGKENPHAAYIQAVKKRCDIGGR